MLFDVYEFDALGREVRHTTPWNAITETAYDGLLDGAGCCGGRNCKGEHGISSVNVRKMKATELEKVVIERMLVDRELKPLRATVNFDVVRVRDREFTGVGFLTEFERSEELKLFDDGASLHWGKVGARLNASKLETGYLIYVDDGYVTTVEGYTYGEEWPQQVEQIELYELKAGEELATPPR